MKRGRIAPFQLDNNFRALTPALLKDLCGVKAFDDFLDLLEEPVIVLDQDNRVIAWNSAAVVTTGIESSDARSMSPEAFFAGSEIDLSPLLSTNSIGQRQLWLSTRAGPHEVKATLYSLTTEAGAIGARLVLLDTVGGKTNPKRSILSVDGHAPTRAEVVPLFPAQLDPLIKVGFRAFQARRRILLLGETGVGKTTLVAQLHRQVNGPGRPFVHVNCSSLSETLFEAEMFGYERGAFTGALAGGKLGFIEAASGGTLFLDEIGDMPRSQQAKLLKFLEDGSIQPVGSVKQKQVDVYVVCATNYDLSEEVRKRTFREDLYYRIAMIPLLVPPLREYKNELPRMIETIIANINLHRRPKLRLSPDCKQAMIEHDYPGNMRELLGIIDRLDLLADDIAGIEHLPKQMLNASRRSQDSLLLFDSSESADKGGLPLRSRVKLYERQLIEEALRSTPSKRRAAKLLGVDISSLVRKIQEYKNIDSDDAA